MFKTKNLLTILLTVCTLVGRAAYADQTNTNTKDSSSNKSGLKNAGLTSLIKTNVVSFWDKFDIGMQGVKQYASLMLANPIMGSVTGSGSLSCMLQTELIFNKDQSKMPVAILGYDTGQVYLLKIKNYFPKTIDDIEIVHLNKSEYMRDGKFDAAVTSLAYNAELNEIYAGLGSKVYRNTLDVWNPLYLLALNLSADYTTVTTVGGAVYNLEIPDQMPEKIDDFNQNEWQQLAEHNNDNSGNIDLIPATIPSKSGKLPKFYLFNPCLPDMPPQSYTSTWSIDIVNVGDIPVPIPSWEQTGGDTSSATMTNVRTYLMSLTKGPDEPRGYRSSNLNKPEWGNGLTCLTYGWNLENILIAGFSDGTVRYYDKTINSGAGEWKILKDHEPRWGKINDIAYSNLNGKEYVLAGGEDGSLMRYDYETKKWSCAQSPDTWKSPVVSIYVTNNQRYAVVSLKNSSIQLYDFQEKTIRKEIQGIAGPSDLLKSACKILKDNKTLLVIQSVVTGQVRQIRYNLETYSVESNEYLSGFDVERYIPVMIYSELEEQWKYHTAYTERQEAQGFTHYSPTEIDISDDAKTIILAGKILDVKFQVGATNIPVAAKYSGPIVKYDIEHNKSIELIYDMVFPSGIYIFEYKGNMLTIAQYKEKFGGTNSKGLNNNSKLQSPADKLNEAEKNINNKPNRKAEKSFLTKLKDLF